MNGTIDKLKWVASQQFGLNVGRFIAALLRSPAYLRDLCRFRAKYQGAIELMPCLHDRGEGGGSMDDEYFWQDLYVARMIREKNPHKHVDAGSRIDGFVAHVASFRELEVFDIRPISRAIPGVTFRQADLMTEQEHLSGYCDSLSCLHALEHFGLGRYGDPIDAEGCDKGLHALSSILMPGGTLYLSVPVGRERVVFNAHRVLSPTKLLSSCRREGLRLISLAWIRPAGPLHESISAEQDLESLEGLDYALAIMVLHKVEPHEPAVTK